MDNTVELKVGERIKQFEYIYIPPIYCTMDQHPDVAIIRKCDGLTLLLVEVHSSPYERTIRKCMLGVSDLLRLHRAHDRNALRCCGFAFPKLPGRQPNKQCVVKVEVRWENLHFRCSLTPFEHILEAREAIMEELEKAKRNAPSPGSPLKDKEEYVIRLSDEDLKIFEEGTMQVKSFGAIMTRCGDKFFKCPVRQADDTALLSLPPHQLPHSIFLQCTNVIGATRYFEYDAVRLVWKRQRTA